MNHRLLAAFTALLVMTGAIPVAAEAGKGIKTKDVILIIFVIAAVGVIIVGALAAVIWTALNAMTGARRAYWPVLVGSLFGTFLVLISGEFENTAASIFGGIIGGLAGYIASPNKKKDEPDGEAESV